MKAKVIRDADGEHEQDDVERDCAATRPAPITSETTSMMSATRP
jgi:hypothetical protein